MPRSSSSRSSPSRSSPSRSSPSRSSPSRSSPSRSAFSYSSPKSPVTMPPTSVPTNPQTSMVTHNHQVERPGFFSNMWTGFGLGAGQSIAMNIFRSDPKVTHVNETVRTVAPVPNLEASLPKEFVQCMKDNNNDKDLCKQFLE